MRMQSCPFAHLNWHFALLPYGQVDRNTKSWNAKFIPMDQTQTADNTSTAF